MSQRNPDDLRAIYGAVLITDPGRIAQLETNIDFRAPAVRAAFALATTGEDAVGLNLIAALTDNASVLYRSNPLDRTEYNFRPDILPLVTLAQKRALSPLTPDEETSFSQAMGNLTQKTGIDADLVNARLQRLEDLMRTLPCGEHNFHRSLALNFINDDINDIKKSTGAYHHGSTEKIHITIPDYAPDTALANIGTLALLDPQDLPGKDPPWTADQYEFLLALHESEHAMERAHPVTTESYHKDYRGQAREIDADRAVLNAMKDFEGSEAMSAYWLQIKNIASFKNALRLGGLSHDTASFLRVHEETGEQLDPLRFHLEKSRLIFKIKDRLAPGESQMANIMGATRDVLTQDETLTPLQRYEAEQFLRDAEAVGYAANPDYPRPEERANAPTLAARSPTQSL